MVKQLLAITAAAALSLGVYAEDASLLNSYNAMYEFYNDDNEDWAKADDSGYRTIEQYSDGSYKIVNPFGTGAKKDVLTFVKTDGNITFQGLKSSGGVKYVYYNNPAYSYVWDSEADDGEYSSYTQDGGYEIVMFYISGTPGSGYICLYWQEAAAPDDNLVIGNEDNVTPWWSAWSTSQNLTGDGTISLDFVNYSDCVNNWDNWVLVLTNSGLSPADAGYDSSQELAVFRADRFGWGPLYNGEALGIDWEDWDVWRADQDGANVHLDIVRQDHEVSFKAVTTCANGMVYNYTGAITGVTSESIGAFLTVEGGHLVITSTTGINAVACDNTDAPTEYYNINGVRLCGDNLPSGIYIKRQGNVVTKVIRR